MGRRGKVKSETLTSDDAVIVVKTRFIDLAETMPSTMISVVLGGHSLEIDLNLSSAEMRKLASQAPSRDSESTEDQEVSC